MTQQQLKESQNCCRWNNPVKLDKPLQIDAKFSISKQLL